MSTLRPVRNRGLNDPMFEVDPDYLTETPTAELVGLVKNREDGGLVATGAGVEWKEESPDRPVREHLATNDTAPEEVLFGPLALVYTPEQRHLAAWDIYQAYLVLAAATHTDLPERLVALHGDNGHGWCMGCGVIQGGYAVRLDECRSLALLDDPGGFAEEAPEWYDEPDVAEAE